MFPFYNQFYYDIILYIYIYIYIYTHEVILKRNGTEWAMGERRISGLRYHLTWYLRSIYLQSEFFVTIEYFPMFLDILFFFKARSGIGTEEQKNLKFLVRLGKIRLKYTKYSKKKGKTIILIFKNASRIFDYYKRYEIGWLK